MDEPRWRTTDEPTRVENPAPGGMVGHVLCSRYELQRLIGSGGMAQVWEAHDGVLGRQVAVKILHPHLCQDGALVARFRQEAVAAARLSHPGIVGVYDTCSDPPAEAIVMELLDASTLRHHLDEHGPLDADTTVRIALRLLDALEAAHRAGIVHRDIKPSNILLCRDGRVMIADFGIAKADDVTELTQEGTLVGTASYLAPEQLTGAPVDARTDLYSLGIVLYECLTGRAPFQGDSQAAVAVARLHSDPIDPRRVRADVPAQLADAVMATLRRDPSARVGSSAELRATLLDTGARPTSAPPLPEPLPGPAPASTAAAPEEASFARSQRGWLVPALFIMLVASAVVVAGLLLREGIDDTAPASTDPGAPPAPSDLALGGAIAHDPQGRGEPGENDDIAGRAVDGDPSTAWRTEIYESPTFFPDKSGVGLVALLEVPAEVTAVEVSGSANGWSGEVHLLDPGTVAAGPDAIDLGDPGPVAVLDDVRGDVRLDLAEGDRAVAAAVMVWITDLGEAAADGHRVDLAEVRVLGVPEDP